MDNESDFPKGGGREEVWDEFQWERFIQEQDAKTEKYLDLMDKYRDHPDRDRLVAEEMGWSFSAAESHMEYSEDDTDAIEIDPVDFENSEDADSGINPNEFESHPLYQSSNRYTFWLDSLLRRRGLSESNDLSVLKLLSNSYLISAKLAAAIGDGEFEELGMTLAYLKRAMRAANLILESLEELQEKDLLPKRDITFIRKRIFQIRHEITILMGTCREEWRKRYGSLE